jgi:hypothetical protein
VPTCPAKPPAQYSSCAGYLSCQYSNGCGGIDYYYCTGSYWDGKGSGWCDPSCPGAKPSTGSSCKPASSSSCTYVTDPINQCTSNCFCSDVGTWACTTPSCSGGGGYPVDAGVPPPSDGGWADAY